MGKKTKIDWCDSSWNPVTGCLHGCEYCYARGIAERFGGYPTDDQLHELDCAQFVRHRNNEGGWNREYKCAYPYSFAPTLHRYSMDIPKRWTKPRSIFVCSMADLFGDWVPDKWIQEVFKACEAAPQHRYIFLTKNPKRYAQIRAKGIHPPANSWIGTSVETSSEAVSRTADLCECWNVNASWFASVEPITEEMTSEAIEGLTAMDWIIIGAETGNRKGKVIPRKSWIDDIVHNAKRNNVPIFMKESLREIMGDDFRQEFPWEVSENG